MLGVKQCVCRRDTEQQTLLWVNVQGKDSTLVGQRRAVALKVAPGSAASTSSENLWELPILWVFGFSKPFRWFWCPPEVKNHQGRGRCHPKGRFFFLMHFKFGSCAQFREVGPSSPALCSLRLVEALESPCSLAQLVTNGRRQGKSN